jgi:hypothetical protein
MERRIARNEAAFRKANEDISTTAEALGVDMPVPLICECADPSCKEIIKLRLEDYAEVRAHPRRFLNAPGHHVAAHGVADVVAEREGYVIVEKRGYAGEVAERLDERGGPDR